MIDWSKVEKVLMHHYSTGTSKEDADAYHPLMLLKGLLLQKWYHIDSEPELANQINDRISFKKFLGLSCDKPLADHSIISRFRSRLTRGAMVKINYAVLQQFAGKTLMINEGIAVDARLVQSANLPIGSDQIRKQREHRETAEGKFDKKGNTLKFSRDLDSDWTVNNNIPHYELKEHASVDIYHGFVLANDLAPSPVHDSHHLPYCVAVSC